MPDLDKYKLIPLPAGAREANLTSPGLLKILKRTGKAIRDDGRWYATPEDVERIAAARRVLQVMQKQLAQMTAAHAEAEAHLAKLTVDEASVEKIVRDTPM